MEGTVNDNVMSLEEAREARKPHVSGIAICGGCKHQWSAVAPLVTEADLECPACGAMRGIWCHNFGPEDGQSRLFCTQCGGQMFYVLLRYNLCVRCGHQTEVGSPPPITAA